MARRCFGCDEPVRFWHRSVIVPHVGTFHRGCRRIWRRLSVLLERYVDDICARNGLPSLKQMASKKPLEM